MNHESISADLGDFMIQQTEEIWIIPQIQMQNLYFVQGSYDEMKPNRPVIVPLWLAVFLKKQGKCKIKAPTWLNIQNLTYILETEKRESTLTKVPENYYEIAQILLSNASEDIKNNEKIQSLLEDIDQQRQRKLKEIINNLLDSQIDGLLDYQRINNITFREVNQRRQMLSECMQKIQNINDAADTKNENEKQSQQYTQSQK